MRRHVSITSTIGLVAALAAAVGAAPVAAADRSADLVGQSVESRPEERAVAQRRTGEAAQLVSATATFGAATRATGMSPATDPRHQFAPIAQGGSLSVTVDYGYDRLTGALTYHYDLDTEMLAPDPDSSTRTVLGFGAFQGNSCVIEEATVAWLYRSIPDVLLYDDKDTDDLASAAGWTCAALLVDGGPGTTPYDAFVSALDVTSATPQLAMRTPKKDRLVKRVWTRIPVKVSNASAEGVDARDVRVVGAGKGVKVRPYVVGSLAAGSDAESHVWARLTKSRATLRLTLTERGETLGRAKVKLRQRPVPAPPKAGRWSSSRVSFTVRGGKVRGFRINTQTTCGGYPDILTTTNNTYDFPTVRIPRNNEVVGKDGKEGAAAYSVYLDLEFVSPTKATGVFSYYGPARCVAIDGFTVKRSR